MVMLTQSDFIMPLETSNDFKTFAPRYSAMLDLIHKEAFVDNNETAVTEKNNP